MNIQAMNALKALFVSMLCIGLTACPGSSQKEVGSQSSPAVGNKDNEGKSSSGIEKQITVSSASFDGTILTVKGNHFDKVKSSYILQGSAKIDLEFTQKSPTEIRAKLFSKLKISGGLISKLILSVANADQGNASVAIPLNIEIPAGSLSPSVLVGTGTTEGAVLKWSGSAWVAAPDLVGVGEGFNCANKMKFVGYTEELNANLQGIRGGHAKCSELYPGSRWAGSKELNEMGLGYPAEHRVWVWDSFGVVHDNHLTATLAAGHTNSCKGWKSASTQYEYGEILLPDGTTKASYCSNKYRLACVK